MSLLHYTEESCPSVIIPRSIIAGEPWVARSIENNNLRQHCRLLGRTFRGKHPLTDSIRAPTLRILRAIADGCGALTNTHPSDFQLIPAVARMASYSRRWIRQPEDWEGENSTCPHVILHSIASHLFCRWELPLFFSSAWLVKGDLTYLEREWYCRVGAGESFRALPGMPPSITSRALHLAREAPPCLTIRRALRWGQVKALGGSEAFLSEVLSSRMVNDLSNDAVWSRLFEKLISSPVCHPGSFGIISDALMEVIEEDGWERARDLVSRPYRELLAHCRRYWLAILDIVRAGSAEWSRIDIQCPGVRAELRERMSKRWTRLPGAKPFKGMVQEGKMSGMFHIVELTHQWQLVQEGFRMRHCVATYGPPCTANSCSIFSVRTEEIVGGKRVTTSHLTIEVWRRTRTVVQVRGRRNSYCNPERVPLLRTWAAEMNLKLR